MVLVIRFFNCRVVVMVDLSEPNSLWFTLESSCSALTPRTLADVERVLLAVQDFAELSLGFEKTAIPEIKLWKLDYTVDLKGSFLTIPSESAQS